MKKLKTFVTQAGFYERAVAVPTKKAAMEVLGVSQHDFQHGFVKQTGDQQIIEQTQARPGVVLSRGVGTKEHFSEHPPLPSIETLESGIKQKTKSKKKKARDSADQKKAEREKVELKKRQANKEKVFERNEVRRKKADTAMERARQRHDEVIEKLNSERDKIAARIRKEEDRWEEERKRLLSTDG